MDYIEGESLDKILKAEGVQAEDVVITWAKQLCDALSYLHTQTPPIIYRDMKPANVMLKPEGNVKIIDFGIAREYKEQNLTDTTVLGTKGYAPPEQYSGQTDARSDIYALGMTMHHLLTGVDPMAGGGYAPVRMWNPELSEGIELIIDRCVQPAAENRYQSCRDLLYDLDHPELITKSYKNKQKRKLKIFAVSACLAVICLASGLVCGKVSANINNNSYDVLLSTSTASSLEDKVGRYKEAISIYPEKTDGYIKLLEAYEDEGKFGKTENDEFLALYNANKEMFDRADTNVAELNYKIGMMYFNYYTEKEGEDRFSTRVQKAYPFLEDNYENDTISGTFANKNLSDSYYQICSFYKRYILNSATVEEASKDDYDALLETVRDALGDVSGAGAYDQLSMYHSIFLLLYDQREQMAQVNVAQEDVLELFDRVHASAEVLTVQKEQSQKLQQTIMDKYEQYKKEIITRYEKLAERK